MNSKQSANAIKRIQRDLLEIKNNPIEGVSIV